MKSEAKFWDDIAKRYAKRPVGNMPAFERKIAITQSKLQPEDVILEIGCGTGSLALKLAEKVKAIHAVDISQNMIDIAREKTTAAGVSNIHYHVATIDEALPSFQANSFSGALAYSILHLVDDRPGTLKQLFNLVKPGGFLISSTVCLKKSWVPYGLILPVMKWIGKAPSVAILSAEELEAELRAAGFVNVSEIDVGAGSDVAFIVAEKPPGPARVSEESVAAEQPA